MKIPLYFFLFIWVLISPVGAYSAQESVPVPEALLVEPTAELDMATVTLDGQTLFHVRGVVGYPANIRAKAIGRRIQAFAANRALPVDKIDVVHLTDRSNLLANGVLLASLLDADAAIERIPRNLLADQARFSVAQAVATYRKDRSRAVLVQRVGIAAGATAGMLLLVLGVGRLFRKLQHVAECHVKSRIDTLASRSFHVIESQPVWAALLGLLRMLRFVVVAFVVYIYLNSVLGLFPWTRPLAQKLLTLFVEPIQMLGRASLDAIPNIAFLAVLIIVTRYVLKVAHLFFLGIEQGTIVFQGFDRDWGMPTYKIVRFLAIAFAVVVAYPYIPGSSSDAFKGVSLFIGVIFSLGSSSFIANMIAGLTMTYRRAFKVGDRVKINDLVGDVVETRLQVTHFRTIKNEEITIPNSLILASSVINFSSLAKKQGLILHTTVGIGYETPWRQVEALLLSAAERTPGLLKEPRPFVFQKALGDFSVTYELNAYCSDPKQMLGLYNGLHQNILDLFNEHGVQIMTPAYEGDPEQPKIVPKEKWFSAPAKGNL